MAAPEFVVDFPTLGDLWSAWIERHCRVPDRHERGKPFREYDWQFWCTAKEGQVRPGVEFDPNAPPLNQAFVYRRTQVIAPQKTGKGPWRAAHVALNAVGPSEFAGWAGDDDVYRCEDHGCSCGWEYDYLPGEPMGMRHPSPLIQIMATSEDQVDNIWRPLTSMIALNPALKELLLPRENFIRIVGDSGDRDMDRIDRVTASALSRLGQPISRGFFDESGLFTKENKLLKVAETMRRGAAGMGGRTHETTNMFDPAEASYAQRTFESQAKDVWVFWRDPGVLRHKDGTALNFKVKRDRARILAYVYAGSSHINLASIGAEADEMMQTDPAQAERFFGNAKVRGQGAWLPADLWERAYAGS